MKDMIQTLNEHRKQNPKDFYASIAYVVLFFVSFAFMMRLAAILDGGAY